MVALSYAQFSARFPEFSTDDPAQQTAIESVALAASLEIDAVAWGDLATEGLYWLTAAKLAIAKINKMIFDTNLTSASGSNSLTNVKRIDISEEVSVEYFDPSTGINKLNYSSPSSSIPKNSYMIEYERLLSLISDGMFYSSELF